MQISRDYSSPNFEIRKNNESPNKVILHYTGMKDTNSALNKLCSSQSKVSSHYLINRDGKIWQLVDEKMTSWHAGVSDWLGEKNLNHSSIGIELCNPGHEFGYKNFPKKQMYSLEFLLKKVILKYNIRPEFILGHSDVAPARKKDPGEKFKWKNLATKGLAAWPKSNVKLPKIYDKKTLIYKSLEIIGYNVKNNLDASIIAFKRHFISRKLDHLMDEEEMRMLITVSKYFMDIRRIS